jgi:hypothetical protein
MKRFIAILILMIVIVGFTTAFIGGEITTISKEKENYKLINESVKETIVVDKSISNGTLQSFKNYDFKGFDFKISFTKETIFDDKEKMIFYVYSVTKPIAVYTKGVLSGFEIKSFEVKQGHWYDRFNKCLAGEMPLKVNEIVLDDEGKQTFDEQGIPLTNIIEYTDTNSCMLYGQMLTENSLKESLKREMLELEKLKVDAKIITGEISENYVYEKVDKDLPDKRVVKK